MENNNLNIDIESLDSQEEFLKHYDSSKYPKACNTVDILLFTVTDKQDEIDIKSLPEKEFKILLIKRKNQPYKDSWAIPGGFVDLKEGLVTSAYRELKEETNIDNVYLEQLYTWGDDVKRDPRDVVFSTSYIALVPEEGLKPKAGDDAKEVAWFTIKKEKTFENDELIHWELNLINEENDIVITYSIVDEKVKNGRISVIKTNEVKPFIGTKHTLAFDHAHVISYGIDRIRNKAEYSPILFNLVPEKFTLTNLQKVYETLLNKTYTPINFRQKIGKYVEKLNEKETGKGFRPADLYRYNGFID